VSRGAFVVALTAGVLLTLSACDSSPSGPSSILPTEYVTPTPSPAAASRCSADKLVHVYHPDRLRVLVPCVTVTGVIDLITPQPDGDFHVRLHLDAGQTCAGQQCLDADNVSGQGGDLLLEPVCMHDVTQADAVDACVGYHNSLVVPPPGTHIAATGPFVVDVDHGWNEIHPLDSIAVLPTATPAPTPTPTLATTVVVFIVVITNSTYGSLAATTLPGASCRAQAQLPAGRISTAAGLQLTVTAAADGSVVWSYRTSANTEPGTGTHTVTCQLNGMSATESAPFTVQ